MKQFNYEQDALLEVLNSAQESMGYLSEDLLIYVPSHLNVPLVQVYGVATFYHMFTFEPLGENNCIICTSTACLSAGAGLTHTAVQQGVAAYKRHEHDAEVVQTGCMGLYSRGLLVRVEKKDEDAVLYSDITADYK